MANTARKFRPVYIRNINEALTSGDPHLICAAIGQAVKEQNISELAKETGLQRASIYRAFSGKKQLPNFTTVLSVLTAIGLQLKVTNRQANPTNRVSDK